jgi:hypothetical protein
MSRLDETSDAFDRFNNAHFRVHVIRNKAIESLWPICDDIRILLRQSEADPDITRRYKEPVFRLRRIVTGLPHHLSDEKIGLAAIAHELQLLAKEDSGLPFQRPLVNAQKVADELSSLKENPLASKLRELVRDGSTIALQDSFYRPLVLQWLSSEFPELKTNVVTFGELAEQTIFQHLVFIGSPQFVAYRYFQDNDYRFARDPKSFENDFIMYPFGDATLNIKGLIDDRNPVRVITASQPMVAPNEIEDLDGESSWTSVEKAAKSKLYEDADTEVSARFIGLAGNHHVYIEDDPQAKVFILVKDEEGKLDVGRIGIRDLKTNSYLLLRTESASSDLIVQIANELGAAKLRSSQERYKELLKQKIKELGGVVQVRKTLEKDFGLVTSRIPDWAFNERRIGPGSQDNFRKLCDFLGIQEEAAKIWKHLEKIRSLHVTAGTEAMERLKSAIRKVPPNDKDLIESGHITRSVPGCGEMGLYRVEHIGEPKLVSVYELQILREPS